MRGLMCFKVPSGMTPEERTSLETQAERHLRRGELADAYAVLSKLSAVFPDEPELALRVEQLEQSLDPAEQRRVAMTRPEPTGKHKTPMHEAESLAAKGRYKEAITIYRGLLAQRPDWDLVKERLAELFELAQVAAPNKPSVDQKGVLEHLLDRISTRKRA